MARQYKTYDKEYKKTIVSLYESGKGISELSREYGVGKSTIDSWIKKYKTITTSTGEVTNNDEINEPPRCRADGVSQGVTTSSIIGYSPIHNLDFLHIPRLLLRLYSYPLLQQNSRLSKIPRPIIFL